MPSASAAAQNAIIVAGELDRFALLAQVSHRREM
jgi:hypothetical protein